MSNLRNAVIVMLLLAAIISCSEKGSPIMPDGPDRYSARFDDCFVLWDSWPMWFQYKNIDLSVIVDGDELIDTLDSPSDWTDIDEEMVGHFTIATTIENIVNVEPPIQIMQYAWLWDQQTDSAYDKDTVFTAYRDPIGEIYEEIAGPKIAAIRPSSVVARVGIVYMSRYSSEYDWDIKLRTLEWEGLGEVSFLDEPPVISDAIDISDSDGGDNGTDDWSPDLAWDADTCLLHIVWTGDTGQGSHPYHVHHTTYDWDSGVGDIAEVSQGDYAGWAPRIAIGSAGIGGYDDIVGIVYSEYNEADDVKWKPCGAYWDPDSEDADDANFMNFLYDDDPSAAGWPRIDLAPRGSSLGYASVAFTQYYAGSPEVYHTIEINNERDDYWVVGGQYNGDYDQEFNAAIAIHPLTNPVSASISQLEREDDEGYWSVVAASFEMDDDATIDGWREPQQRLIGGDLEFLDDFVDFLQIETFQMSDIVSLNGTPSYNAYWLGFCGSAIDSEAASVLVVYGDTSQY